MATGRAQGFEEEVPEGGVLRSCSRVGGRWRFFVLQAEKGEEGELFVFQILKIENSHPIFKEPSSSKKSHSPLRKVKDGGVLSPIFGGGRSKNFPFLRRTPMCEEGAHPLRLPSDLRPILRGRRLKIGGGSSFSGSKDRRWGGSSKMGGFFEDVRGSSKMGVLRRTLHLRSLGPKQEPPFFDFRGPRLGRRSPWAPW